MLTSDLLLPSSSGSEKERLFLAEKICEIEYEPAFDIYT